MLQSKIRDICFGWLISFLVFPQITIIFTFYIIPITFAIIVFTVAIGKLIEANIRQELSSKVNLILKKDNNYELLINEHEKISNYSDCILWVEKGEKSINNFREQINLIKKEFRKYETQHDILFILSISSFLNKLHAEHKKFLLERINKLKSYINITPKSVQEKNYLVKNLKKSKKELQLRKRNHTINKKVINNHARVARAGVQNGVYGSSLKRHSIRFRQSFDVSYEEDHIIEIEREILQLDENIFWLESLKE